MRGGCAPGPCRQHLLLQLRELLLGRSSYIRSCRRCRRSGWRRRGRCRSGSSGSFGGAICCHFGGKLVLWRRSSGRSRGRRGDGRVDWRCGGVEGERGECVGWGGVCRTRRRGVKSHEHPRNPFHSLDMRHQKHGRSGREGVSLTFLLLSSHLLLVLLVCGAGTESVTVTHARFTDVAIPSRCAIVPSTSK